MTKNQMDTLGPLYASNVELDRDIEQLLSRLVAAMRAGGVSKRHILASMMRVLTHNGQRL